MVVEGSFELVKGLQAGVQPFFDRAGICRSAFQVATPVGVTPPVAGDVLFGGSVSSGRLVFLA
jgi:hypothetical protein